ncbi:pyridoxamine 5'-phosphate oxidase family protein [Rhizobium mayense]|uniref:pyridoxamine 5'-phosphate oxidase family protein n=1 Tax=Rhizobium mayense TaxID=1312184 RepID=UPI000DE38F6A
MAALQLNPDFAIDDEQSLRELFEPTHSLALLKCQESLGEHAREFIRRSPFLCIGSQHPDGKADVSPRGDPPGFVKVLDERTIAIPDRPGNNRLDTLANIVANPNVGLLFVIPGFEDTLRINGQAALTRDPEILKDMAVAGRVPKLAIIVSVSEVFLHCAKAFRRSRLWSADHFQDRSEMPSLIKMILDETTGAPTDQNEMRTMDEGLEEDYQRTLY